MPVLPQQTVNAEQSPRAMWSHAFALSASDSHVDRMLTALSLSSRADIFTAKIPNTMALGRAIDAGGVRFLRGQSPSLGTVKILHVIAIIAQNRRIYKAGIGKMIWPSFEVRVSGRAGVIEPVMSLRVLSAVSGVDQSDIEAIVAMLDKDGASIVVEGSDGERGIFLKPGLVDDTSVLHLIS